MIPGRKCWKILSIQRKRTEPRVEMEDIGFHFQFCCRSCLPPNKTRCSKVPISKGSSARADRNWKTWAAEKLAKGDSFVMGLAFSLHLDLGFLEMVQIPKSAGHCTPRSHIHLRTGKTAWRTLSLRTQGTCVLWQKYDTTILDKTKLALARVLVEAGEEETQ